MMLPLLADKPYKDMAVEDHVFELEILLVLIFVDEGCLKFTLLSYIELLDLYLLGKVNAVLGHSLEDGFLSAPLDRELLVPLVLLQVIDLILREGLLLHYREVSVE